MELYEWQKDIVEHEGDIAIVGGRQVGKSVGAAYRIVSCALKHAKSISLIIAASERQENYLFEKVSAELEAKGKLDPDIRQVKEKLTLKNGSIILKYPVGTRGYFVKGITIDFLYCDEAGYLNELVWDSVIPALAVARGKGLGWMTLLSTAFGQRGYFYKCFSNDKFKQISITAHDCPHITNEFLEEELERMGQRRFDQEYNAIFLEDEGQYFPNDLIVKIMNFRFWDKKIDANRKFYLGIDFAGMGADEEAYCCGELLGSPITNLHNETLQLSRMGESLKMTDKLDRKFHFKQIFIDSGGMGVGYEDIFKERYGKRKVIGLNNASKSKEKDSKILKEDLYSNCLRLMEEGNLLLIQDDAMAKSLQSVMTEDGKIGGKNTHLAEALVRMCWCVKEKGLNLFIA